MLELSGSYCKTLWSSNLHVLEVLKVAQRRWDFTIEDVVGEIKRQEFWEPPELPRQWPCYVVVLQEPACLLSKFSQLPSPALLSSDEHSSLVKIIKTGLLTLSEDLSGFLCLEIESQTSSGLESLCSRMIDPFEKQTNLPNFRSSPLLPTHIN